jgi:pimeloyl-ACP methyl ester carboxylesterase
LVRDRIRTLRRGDGAVVTYRFTQPNPPTKRPALVLLHGLASNRTRWAEFVEHTALARHYPMICVDLRGHGGSMTRRRIGLDLWCDDVRAVLDDAGQAQALVIGHSLGAHVAAHCAARFPQRVRGVGLIDPIFPETLRGRWVGLRLFRPLLAAGASAARGLNALGIRRRCLAPLDLRALDQLARIALGTPEGEAAFVKRYGSTRADLHHVPVAVYLQDLAEMTRAMPLPHTLGVPVLLLLSTSPAFTNPDRTRALVSGSAAVQICPIHCHHWPLTEKPEEVRDAIEAWCARILGSAD